MSFDSPAMMNGSPFPRSIALLGSTGSIGRQSLDVVRRHPGLFRVDLLTAGSNAELLIEQALEFGPRKVVIADRSKEGAVREALADHPIEVESGGKAIEAAAGDEFDLVLAAMVGYAGLRPVLAAARRGTDIALANKEALVVAGSLLTEAIAQSGSSLIPVDSEHSAIFQCLEGEPDAAVEELVLTASGGPFRSRPVATFADITRAEALKHPNWSMGPKITIDSATMMNKGLELIEARWLFGLESDAIRIVIHPQSIIHSMVLFVDGSMKAQLSMPDMQLPIQYAMTYPERLACERGRIDWSTVQRLDFEEPDPERFPCVPMAYDALRRGGTAPAILNAANEEAVALFLDGRIGFTDIARVIAETIADLEIVDSPQLADLEAADERARRHVQELKQAATN